MTNEFCGAKVLRSVKLKGYTTFRIGGKAEMLHIAENTECLVSFLKNCQEKNITVLGRGSNVLVSSKGVKGLTVIMRTEDTVFLPGGTCIVDAGISLPRLSRMFYDNSLTGLEWAAQIPGSLGGGLRLNCGAFGKSMADITVWVEVFRNGETLRINASECDFSYRNACFKDGDIILRAKLKGQQANQKEILAKVNAYKVFRKKTQPSGFNAGSVFKGAEKPAGWYIDRAGLKGLECGRAVVSNKHANFIINTGFASSVEVERLISIIKAEVMLKFNVELETEIQMIGEF